MLLRHNITLTALSESITDLSSDARTLLGTPTQMSVVHKKPSSYYHFGLKNAVRTISLLLQYGISLIGDKPNYINLLIDIDSITLSLRLNLCGLFFIQILFQNKLLLMYIMELENQLM